MIDIETTVTIKRPVHDVFEFVTTPENGPLYDSGVELAEQVTEGPVAVGTRWREVRSTLGRKIDATNEISEYVPDRKVGFKSIDGPIDVWGTWEFTPMDGGTKVTLKGHGDVGGFFKIAEPLVGRMVKRQLDATAENLKDYLESAKS